MSTRKQSTPHVQTTLPVETTETFEGFQIQRLRNPKKGEKLTVVNATEADWQDKGLVTTNRKGEQIKKEQDALRSYGLRGSRPYTRKTGDVVATSNTGRTFRAVRITK